MQLRQAISAKEIEQSFLTDLFQAVQLRVLSQIRGWPSPRYLRAELSVWQDKNSVSYDDLYRTLLFRDPENIQSFLACYKRFSFLVPRVVSRYGLSPGLSNAWQQLDGDNASDLATLSSILDRKLRLSAGDVYTTLRQLKKVQMPTRENSTEATKKGAVEIPCSSASTWGGLAPIHSSSSTILGAVVPPNFDLGNDEQLILQLEQLVARHPARAIPLIQCLALSAS